MCNVLFSPYISSCLIGCWLSDPINNLYGRRGTIFGAAIFCTLSVIGSAFAQTWPQLLVRTYPSEAVGALYIFLTKFLFQICRLLLGLGMGIKASTVPIYAAENTPASIRGGLVMSWQMWVCAKAIYRSKFANLIQTIRVRLRLESFWVQRLISLCTKPGQLPGGFNLDLRLSRQFRQQLGFTCVLESRIL